MFDTPASFSLLYSLFMGVSFLGLFTICTLAAGAVFDSIRHVQGRFTLLMLFTPLVLTILYVLGAMYSWSLWAVGGVLLLSTALEVGLLYLVQRDELTLSQLALFLFPLRIALFFACYGFALWLQYLYATEYGFAVVMAFTIYVVGKMLCNMLLVVLGKLSSKTSLYLAASLFASLPLLWIAFEQNFQFGYMIIMLLYAAVFDVLLLWAFMRRQPHTPAVIGGSVFINILMSVAVLLLLTGSYGTQVL